MPTKDSALEAMRLDTFQRAFMSRLQAAQLSGEKLVREHQERTARALISAGLTLIPSDYLLDHQYVVSRGVYEAAKRLFAEKGPV